MVSTLEVVKVLHNGDHLVAELNPSQRHVATPCTLANPLQAGIAFAQGEIPKQATGLDCLSMLIGRADLKDHYLRALRGAQVNVALVSNPRLCFRHVLAALFERETVLSIHPSAIIDPEAIIGSRCGIGPNVVIGAGVKVGSGTTIAANSYLDASCQVGSYCRIGSNVSIGQPGFGYVKDDANIPVHIPHLGSVRIGNDVHIGSGSIIDRGTIEDTKIADHVRIGPLVTIHHNVRIGKGSLVVSNIAICGSAQIGEDCWIAPGAVVTNGIQIGDRSVVGLGQRVLKSLPQDHTLSKDRIVLGRLIDC